MATKTRESTDEKALRLLREGRLTILRLDEHFIYAQCKGDHETYRLTYADGHWNCSCPARADCSHMRALWLVTVRHGDTT